MKVLCLCKGNSDRSPAMAAVLQKFLRDAGRDDVVCESAGVYEAAKTGGGAPQYAINAARMIGVDLSGHEKRHISQVDLNQFDLIICAKEDVAGLAAELGAPMNRLYTAQEIFNPWPNGNQDDFYRSFRTILAAMYNIVLRHFS